MNTASPVALEKTGLPDLLPAILQLPTFDKVRLIRILAENIELPASGMENMLLPNQAYHIHTPVFADGAAAELMKLLEETKPEN